MKKYATACHKSQGRLKIVVRLVKILLVSGVENLIGAIYNYVFFSSAENILKFSEEIPIFCLF